MTTVQQKINAIELQLEKLRNEQEVRRASMEQVKPMYEQFKGWAEEYALASTEQKKMIISQIISRIELGKGYRIKIRLNVDYEQFCEGWNGLNNERIGVDPSKWLTIKSVCVMDNSAIARNNYLLVILK